MFLHLMHMYSYTFGLYMLINVIYTSSFCFLSASLWYFDTTFMNQSACCCQKFKTHSPLGCCQLSFQWIAVTLLNFNHLTSSSHSVLAGSGWGAAPHCIYLKFKPDFLSQTMSGILFSPPQEKGWSVLCMCGKFMCMCVCGCVYVCLQNFRI